MSYRAKLQAFLLDWEDDAVNLGGPGSGHHGHAGVIGQKGGSAPSGEPTNGTPSRPRSQIDVATAERGGTWYTTHFSDDPNRAFTTTRHAFFHPEAEFEQHQLDGVEGVLIRGAVTLKHPKVVSSDESVDMTAAGVAALKAQGYDGVINEEGWELIAFDPEKAHREMSRIDNITKKAAPRPLKPITEMTQQEYEDEVLKGTHYHDSLYRSGEPQATDVFLARSLMDLDRLGNAAKPVGYHGVVFKTPLVSPTKASASYTLLNKNIYEGLKATVGAPPSDQSRAILHADDVLGRAARERGHDAIVLPNEVQVLNRTILPPAERVQEGEEGYLDAAGDQLYEGMGYDRAKARSRKSLSLNLGGAGPALAKVAQEVYKKFALRGTDSSGHHGHAGRPGQVGGSAPSGLGEGDQQVALRPATDADAKRIAHLRVPPAYRAHVLISDDPDADLQATWTDAKERTQYRYSAEHSERAAAEKFARLKDFNAALPALRERITTDLSDTRLSETDRDAAAILRLIDQTGFRPGSEGDTGAEKKAYGATTLKAGHVRIDGDKLSFRFPSKSGQVTAKTITDPVLAKLLTARKAQGGRLFPHASDADVRDYLHARDGDFKVKDWRTWNGTNKALEMMAKMPVPKTDAAFKKAQREVAKKVAKHLGNTPAIALKSYIDPAVFSKWKAKKP